VLDSPNVRIYLSPMEATCPDIPRGSLPFIPTTPILEDTRAFTPPDYGMPTYGALFTSRQLLALDTFSDLVQEARAKAIADAVAAGMTNDGIGIAQGGKGATAYGDALAVYLAFAVDRCADYWSKICSWHNSGEKIRNTFSLQAIPMMWSYTEGNPFSDCTWNWLAMVDWGWKVLAALPARQLGVALLWQRDTSSQWRRYAIADNRR